MICLVYISSANYMINEREIVSIVNAARINNEKAGITGILLYNNGNFMQLIEGKDDVIKKLYDKISADPRHHTIKLLLREQITHRNFDGWQMGYRNLNSLKKIAPEILNPFLEEELNFSIYKNNPYRALHFLEMFKKIII